MQRKQRNSKVANDLDKNWFMNMGAYKIIVS